MNGGSRTPGVSQPLWECCFQPGKVSRGGDIFDGTEQDSKEWREALRQTRLKWRALPRASCTYPPAPQNRKLLSQTASNWAGGVEKEVDAGLSKTSSPQKACFQSSPSRDLTYCMVGL